MTPELSQSAFDCWKKKQKNRVQYYLYVLVQQHKRCVSADLTHEFKNNFFGTIGSYYFLAQQPVAHHHFKLQL